MKMAPIFFTCLSLTLPLKANLSCDDNPKNVKIEFIDDQNITDQEGPSTPSEFIENYAIEVFTCEEPNTAIYAASSTGDHAELDLEPGCYKIQCSGIQSQGFKVKGEEAVQIEEGQTYDIQVSNYLKHVQIEVPTTVSYGQALYITGSSTELGNWKTAKKMTFEAEKLKWQIEMDLQYGQEFKLVMAPWQEDQTISTEIVQWQLQDNYMVNSKQISVYPQF